MKEKLYNSAPEIVQNSMISLFNLFAYKKRYGGNYKKYLKKFKKNRSLSLDELKAIQQQRLDEFVSYAKENSQFYGNLYASVNLENGMPPLEELPIIDKESLRKNGREIFTIPASEGLISKTGGTTGKSLEVIYTLDNMQERFAMLDDFRARQGYKLGEKTAWFSGKNLITERDIKKNRFWKTDHIYKVRYYSTFHIKNDYLKFYIEDLITFKPKYFVGFPSTIFELAKYGKNNGYDFPANTVKAIFPTAETVTNMMRTTIESFFKTKMYDQYASSEGAPFIFECENGNLHLELQSGVFEVLDDNNRKATTGKLVITSFTTKGTPLIRYDIGDSITLEEENRICGCGNNNPLVKEIKGRIDDFVYSPQNGKINLGNISNTLKGTKGIIKFQAVQEKLDAIKILLVVDRELYSSKTEKIYLENWRDRIGNKMELSLDYVEEIEVEKSGKFRFVKNHIKHLIG